MMKLLQIALIILGLLVGIWTVLGLTDRLKMYNIPTTANELGIELNSKT